MSFEKFEIGDGKGGNEKKENLLNRQENREEIKKFRIVSEKISEEEKEKYLLSADNPFSEGVHKKGEKQLQYVSPRVKNFPGKGDSFYPDTKITVSYVDHLDREIETEWRIDEYLKRIGFKGDFSKKQKPFERFREVVKNESDLDEYMCNSQKETIQDRINSAYAFDKKLDHEAGRSKQGAISRERQLSSQYEEDPYFVHMLDGSNYIFPVELSIHHDYKDAIDALVQIDITEGFDDDWKEEPVYLGVQRTLLEADRNRFAIKERKIKEKPLWYLPEYPERNPVLRVLYRENPEEYHTENEGLSRWQILQNISRERDRKDPNRFKKNKKDEKQKKTRYLRADSVILGDTEEEVLKNYKEGDREKKKIAELKMISKTLDVLYQALDNIAEYKEKKDEFPHHFNQIFQRYERAIKKIVKIIEEDNDLSREQIYSSDS